MITIKVKYKAVKDVTRSIWIDKLDSNMMASKWNITQDSCQS